MLEQERRMHARKGFDAAVQRGVAKSTDREYLRTILAEQCKTQNALSELGKDHTITPDEIPHVNTIFAPQIEIKRDKPVYVSVIGMPKGAKTTTLSLIGSNEYEPREVVGERAGLAKTLLEEIRYFSFDRLRELKTIMQLQDYEEQLNYWTKVMEEDKWREPLTVVDRDHQDIPMDRANLQFGRIKLDTLRAAENTFDQFSRTSIKRTNNAIVLAMITPQESLKRECPREAPGRIMQLPFLQVLYEQYLRFHYEILTNQERPFVYCCVDMESSSELESPANLRSIINQIYIYLAPYAES